MKWFYFYKSKDDESSSLQFASLESPGTLDSWIYDELAAKGQFPVGGFYQQDSIAKALASAKTITSTDKLEEVSENENGRPMWGLELNTDQFIYIDRFKSEEDAYDWVDAHSDEVITIILDVEGLKLFQRRFDELEQK